MVYVDVMQSLDCAAGHRQDILRRRMKRGRGNQYWMGTVCVGDGAVGEETRRRASRRWQRLRIRDSGGGNKALLRQT